MSVNWEDFTPVNSVPKADGQVDWSQFEPVKADNSGNFVRGAKVAWGQTAPLAKGLVGAVGAAAEDIFGEGGISTAIKDWGIKGYQEGMAKLQPLQHENDDVTVAWEKAKQGNIGALADWVAYGLGYGAVQIGEAAATGGIGALIGKTGVQAVAKGTVEKMVSSQAAKIAASEAGAKMTADQLAAAATKVVANKIEAAGAGVALQGYNEMMEVGSIYPDAVEQAQKEGRKMTGSDLAKVWGWGTLAAATESATDMLGLGALTGKIHMPGAGGRVARATTGALVGGAVEGGQEGVQTWMEWQGAGKDTDSPEFKKDLINSMAMGALPGGVVGGVAGGIHRPAIQKPAATPEDVLSAPDLDSAIEAASAAVAAPLALPHIAGEPLVVFQDGSTMTAAEAEQQRLAGMTQSAIVPAEPIDAGRVARIEAEREKLRGMRAVAEERADQSDFEYLAKSESADLAYLRRDALDEQNKARDFDAARAQALAQHADQAQAVSMANEPPAVPTAMQLAMEAARQKAAEQAINQGAQLGTQSDRTDAAVAPQGGKAGGDVVPGGRPIQQGIVPGGAGAGNAVAEVAQPGSESVVPVRDAGQQAVAPTVKVEPEGQFDPRPDGTIRVKGYTREEIQSAAKSIGAKVLVGTNGNAVFAKGANLEKLRAALSAGVDVPAAKTSRPLRLSGSLANDLKVLGYGGLREELARGGDGAKRFDLSLLAERLRNEAGYVFPDVNDDAAQGVTEFILQDIANGGGTLNAERSVAAMDAVEREKYRADIRQQADELGVRRIGREFSAVEAEVLKLAQMRLDDEIKSAGKTLESLRMDLAKWGIDEDVAAQAEDDAVDALGENPSILKIYRAVALRLEDLINERIEDEARRENSGIDGEGGRARSSETESRGDFALEGQTEAEARSDQERLAAAEAQRLKEEQAAENKRQADAERNSFSLTGSDRPADVLAAQGQGGLFDAPAPETKPSTIAGKSVADMTDDQLRNIARGMSPTYGESAVDKAKTELRRRDADLVRKGTNAVAQRQVNAVERFVESVTEQFGLSREDAGKAWDYLFKNKLVKVDAVGGQYELKDGRLWNRDSMAKAAEELIAGKSVTEISDKTLGQIAKSSQPAAEKAKAEVARHAAGHHENGMSTENLQAQQETAGDAGAPAEPPPASAIDAHQAFAKRVRAGDVKADEFRKAYADFKEARPAMEAELNQRTLKELAPNGTRGMKKPQIIDRILDQLGGIFTLNKSVSYVMGAPGGYNGAVAKIVSGITDADLQEFAEDIRAARAERKQARAEAEKAITNPQTLDDFRTYIRAKKADGMSFAEARMTLTPEQRATFDDLTATESRDERKARADQQRSDVRVAATTTDGQIIETEHTRDHYPLFVVKASERVERDVYNHWNATAKRLGGWYSSFRGNGAIPGFQFKTSEAAQAFLDFIGGNAEKAQETVQARRNAFEDDRSQTAVERLNEMADRLDDQAGESLSVERKANTARRARFAASAEAAARYQQAMAATMRNIAAEIESGKAKFLDRVRQKVQVERLQSWLRNAHDAELRAKYPTYAEQEKHQGERPTAEVADYAQFPEFTAYRSDLARMGRHLAEIDGAKQLSSRLLKVADDVTEAYKKFAKENLYRVSTFKTQDGKAAVFRTADAADAAIARSGFKGKATTISFKRGEHLVIMGPEMAKEAGLWTGDDDKRITLNPEFADEIVAKAKGRDIGMPYTFETVSADRARLRAMGIETPAEFRAALREFIATREAPKGEDRVKKLEREMIGRRKDGLDFYPTASATSDEMIETAGIKPGMMTLEPEAGMGHIADRIREAGIEPDVAELSGDRLELLEAKGYNVVGRDFLEMTLADTPDGKGYDRIIMNPPFSDRRDAEHIQHAYTLLKPNGRIVALAGEGVFFGQDKKAQAFRDWLDSVGGTSEKLAEGTFMDPSLPVNTGVNARMVVIDKPAGGMESRRSTAHANEFVTSPDGSIDFGQINADQAKAMRRQAGKIRLTQGVQNPDGTGYGLAHIKANHEKQIRNAGFDSVEKFIAHIAQDFGEIWQATGSQLLAAYRDGQQHMMYIQLEPARDEAGDYYRVNSALPVRQDDYPEKHGFKKLWDGSEPTSVVTGKQPAFAGLPENSSGQTTPNARSQSSTTIAQQADGIALDSRADEMTPEMAARIVAGASMPIYTGSSVESIRTSLASSFGKSLIARLERDGLLRIVASADDVPAQVGRNTKAKIIGDVSYLIADRMNPATAKRELLHEIGEHYGLKRMLGEKGYAALGSRVRFLEKAGNARVREAYDTVRELYPEVDEGSEEFMHEVLANIGQDAEIRQKSWWKELIAAVKRFVVKLGFATPIKDSDIQDMVLHSLKMAGREEQLAGAGNMVEAMASRYDSPVTADKTPRQSDSTSGPAGATSAVDLSISDVTKLTSLPGKVFVRWSSGPEFDMVDGAASRDYVSGSSHAGLSAVQLKDGMSLADLAKYLGEYGFLRIKGNGILPHLYRGEIVGMDSDGYPSIRPTKYLGRLSRDSVSALDSNAADRLRFQEQISDAEKRLSTITDPIGKEIVAERLASAKKGLEDAGGPIDINSPSEPSAPGKVGAGKTALESRSRITGNSGRDYTPEQLASAKRIGRVIQVPSLKERLASYAENIGMKLRQGVADQFAPLEQLDKHAYIQARLSKAYDGALEALMLYGKVKVDGGIYNADMSGGVLDRLLRPLGKEADDFMWWVAAKRAERLSAEDREHLFTAEDIAANKSLATGRTDFDYTLSNGTVTRSRELIYHDAARILDEFNRSIMDIAEESGLIDGESRSIWEHGFYVPFYRALEDEKIGGPGIKSGLVRQYAFKQLKGGSEALNHDLIANTLQNWAHLLAASAKNRAAASSLKAAVRADVAEEVAAGTKGAVYYLDNGQQKHFLVSDPFLMDAITALEFGGFKGPVMNVLGKFKHYLTVGVTANPAFKVRNLIRDSIAAIGQSGLDTNPLKNISQGFKATDKKSQTYVSMLASGGIVKFGTMLEGNSAGRVRQLIEEGVSEDTILDGESKIKAFWRRKIMPAIEAYNDLGDRGESINRAALYEQMLAKGMSHEEASYAARDLLDFSMGGTWQSVRLLTQVVPFMNARIQGLYKLGRSDKKRLGYVTGAVALASLALLAAYGDDEDWKKREDWDRDGFWWFKFGGIAFRIPKPFEIGAIGTLAERSAELFFDNEMTGKRYIKRLWTIVTDQLAMNPVPQFFKPIADIYSNKDSFTGRPIETMGMEKLRPEDRYTARSSEISKLLSKLGQPITGVVGKEFLSPVQIDQAIRGYFGWLGTTTTWAIDFMARNTVLDSPARPEMQLRDVFLAGNFVETLPSNSSRYVSQMYDQAKEIEEAWSSMQHYRKLGEMDKARQIMEENRDKLGRYRAVEAVKRSEAEINRKMQQIENSLSLSPEAKREALDRLSQQRDRVAKRLATA